MGQTGRFKRACEMASGVSFLLLLFPVQSASQVSITADDLLALIGSAVELSVHEESMLNVDLGNTGANQVWDFTGLMPDEQFKNYSFLTPSETPFESSFSEANLTLRVTGFESEGGTIYQYLRIMENSGEVLGFGGVFTDPDTSIVIFTPENPLLPLPLSMGLTFDEVARDTTGNIAVTGSIVIDSTHNIVDAWGVVHINNDRSFDVIRIRGEEHDRTEFYVNGQLVSTSSAQGFNYEWWSPTHFIVVSISSMGNEQNPNFAVAGNVEVLTGSATQPPAEAPGNLGPADGADVTQTPNLEWSSAPDVFAFWLQVADNPSFTKQGNSALLVDVQGIQDPNYIVNGLTSGITYYWRVRGQNALGDGPWSNSLSFTTVGGLAAEQKLGEVPLKFKLYPSYPNPFNPTATIRFDVASRSNVDLSIYDMLGRKVRTLVDENMSAGTYEVIFDADGLPSGAYIYRLVTAAGTFSNSMILLR